MLKNYSKHALVIIISICGIDANAQKTVEPETLAMGFYYKCVDDYAKRLAPTKELPADIADASLSQCAEKREGVKVVLMNTPAGKNVSTKFLDDLMIKIDNNAKKSAIKTVLETRYPIQQNQEKQKQPVEKQVQI